MPAAQKIPRPIKRVGYRNVFCRLYNDCLDYAVENKWLNFACPDGCPHLHEQEEVAIHPALSSSVRLHKNFKWEMDV